MTPPASTLPPCLPLSSSRQQGFLAFKYSVSSVHAFIPLDSCSILPKCHTLLFFFNYTYLFTAMYRCVPQCQGNFQKSVLSFHHTSSRGHTQSVFTIEPCQWLLAAHLRSSQSVPPVLPQHFALLPPCCRTQRRILELFICVNGYCCPPHKFITPNKMLAGSDLVVCNFWQDLV